MTERKKKRLKKGRKLKQALTPEMRYWLNRKLLVVHVIFVGLKGKKNIK